MIRLSAGFLGGRRNDLIATTGTGVGTLKTAAPFPLRAEDAQGSIAP
jgi:hypothetical protein